MKMYLKQDWYIVYLVVKGSLLSLSYKPQYKSNEDIY